jgi:hypothetical protein
MTAEPTPVENENPGDLVVVVGVRSRGKRGITRSGEFRLDHAMTEGDGVMRQFEAATWLAWNSSSPMIL